MNNPLLEAIHGVSLQDYAAVSAKMVSGVKKEDILAALGIENAIYEEASAMWVARMQEDKDFIVVNKFGHYFGDVENHPKLSGLKSEINNDGDANLEKLKADRHFYEELAGARIAAYQYGYDGAQWILDNFGISLGDFQSIAMKWAETSTAEDTEEVHYWADFQEQKQNEYSLKFASEQGGNVADDVEF